MTLVAWCNWHYFWHGTSSMSLLVVQYARRSKTLCTIFLFSILVLQYIPSSLIHLTQNLHTASAASFTCFRFFICDALSTLSNQCSKVLLTLTHFTKRCELFVLSFVFVSSLYIVLCFHLFDLVLFICIGIAMFWNQQWLSSKLLCNLSCTDCVVLCCFVMLRCTINC